ncbi:MAG: S8 family peptidase [Polyangiales bacterium]
MTQGRATVRRWALGGALAVAAAVLPRAAAAQTADTVEIVVDFDDGTSAGEAREVAARHGLTLTANSQMAGDDGIYRAVVPRAREARVLRELSRESSVEAAEENIEMRALFTPNDPLFEQQWGLRRVGGEAAWDVTCGRGVVVAVVDTGVACENHGEFTRVPDLEGARCLPGWNFVTGDAHANDDQGHGTHVAGTIAQTTHNALGGAGVAYCASILPVKVLDTNGRGTLANVAEGIRWAADHGADVINLSLGGGGRSKVMEQAVAYARSKGSTVVCAAGNNGRYVESPANAPGAVAVSAIDDGDQIAFFSSRGPEVDLAAPGVQILQQTICNRGRDRCEQFASWSGTSMAAPHVAGVAALVHSLGVTDPDAVEAALKAHTSRPAHGASDAELYGAGIVSASEVTRGVLLRQGYARLASLALVAIALAFYIRRRSGTLGVEGVLPAYLTGVGLFFLPSLLPRQTPGVDLLMRPLAGWDTVLLGSGAHRWLAFANAGVVMLLVGVGFGRRWLRGTIGGVAAGVAAYLIAEVYLGTAFPPMGRALYLAWAVANAAVCLWVARIGLDRKTAG